MSMVYLIPFGHSNFRTTDRRDYYCVELVLGTMWLLDYLNLLQVRVNSCPDTEKLLH